MTWTKLRLINAGVSRVRLTLDDFIEFDASMGADAADTARTAVRLEWKARF